MEITVRFIQEHNNAHHENDLNSIHFGMAAMNQAQI